MSQLRFSTNHTTLLTPARVSDYCYRLRIDRFLFKSSKYSFEVVSPNLLKSVKIHPVHPEFSLGLEADYPYFGYSISKNTAIADTAGPSRPPKRQKALSSKQ